MINLLYCGDRNISDGLAMSLLSVLKQTEKPLCVYVLTAGIKTPDKTYQPIENSLAVFLDEKLKEKNAQSSLELMDISGLFKKEPPQKNMQTRFTPMCMLRLFADEIEALPDKILYLDGDVICRKDFSKMYDMPLSDAEMAGVLDYYGRWFFRKNPFKSDYLNSGVLLLNLKKIRETGLFRECRKMCREKKMFMPDQSALNKLSGLKKILPRRFNEQRKLKSDTVFQHFTTSFRFLPYFHSVTVKPWQIDKMHNILKLHEYDSLYSEFRELMQEFEREKEKIYEDK